METIKKIKYMSEQDTTEVLDCFTVIVGKDASKDGSVLLGHNEQNRGRRIINYRKVPRIKHKKGDVVKLKNGGEIPEVEETYSFLWTESPGIEFSDSYLNEWGVAIVADSCPTKEDPFEELVKRGDIVDGGIGYMLARIPATKAKTAREALDIICDLINQFGYSASGRTISIADQNEAWVLSIASGKRWIAQRVPDDAVVLVPNVHIIGEEANIEDKENVFCSEGLVEYAIKRGWYNPSTKKPFSFREAFNGEPKEVDFMKKYNCDSRQWYSQCLVTGKRIELPVKSQLAFSVKPTHKYTVNDVAKVLRSHLEGTEFDFTDGYKTCTPHRVANEARNICSTTTQESVVFQLRNWMIADVGCVAWRTSFSPCSSVYTPWYLGITQTPEVYYKKCEVEKQLTLDHHFDPPEEIYNYDSEFAFWKFYSLVNLVDTNYKENIIRVQKIWKEYEEKEFALQPVIEEVANKLYEKDKNLAKEFLTDYSRDKSLQAINIADKLVSELLDNN